MSKLEFVHLAEAEEMSKNKLELEIGKRTMYLREQFGMDPEEATRFTASLLNLGAAASKRDDD